MKALCFLEKGGTFRITAWKYWMGIVSNFRCGMFWCSEDMTYEAIHVSKLTNTKRLLNDNREMMADTQKTLIFWGFYSFLWVAFYISFLFFLHVCFFSTFCNPLFGVPLQILSSTMRNDHFMQSGLFLTSSGVWRPSKPLFSSLTAYNGYFRRRCRYFFTYFWWEISSSLPSVAKYFSNSITKRTFKW